MSNHFVTCDSVNGFHTFLPATENWFIKKPVRSWEMQKAFKIKGKKKEIKGKIRRNKRDAKKIPRCREKIFQTRDNFEKMDLSAG